MHQPHFPGYPVYIAAGRLAQLLIGSPEWAMVTLSALAGAACALLICRIAGRGSAGLLAGAALAVNPLFFSFSQKIFAEIPAIAFLLLAVALLGDPSKAAGRSWFYGCASLGLMLGVRLSYWPFAFFYVAIGLLRGRFIYGAGGMAVGVLIWLVPQAGVVGASELMEQAVSFTAGHFTDWGGSALNGPGWFDRLFTFFRNLFAVVGVSGFPFGLPWLLFSIFAVRDLFKRGGLSEDTGSFAAATAFYLVWAFFGQNIDNLRHLLPALPAFILLIASAMARHWKAAALSVFILAFTVPLNHAYRSSSVPPAVGFLSWVERVPEKDAVFYCGESERFFDFYKTSARVVSVKTARELDFKMKAAWPEPTAQYVCDDIPGFVKPATPKGVVAIFPARLGDPVDTTLIIYRY